MRALLPLCTAAALALGGWLALGTVTVRSLEMPARIGWLPPLRYLLAVLLPLLALSFISPATRSWRRLGVLFLLLAPLVLPWLPVPVPDALLVWTGPLAWAWWIACVAYAHADVWTWMAARTAWLWRDVRRAPATAALLTGLALVATAWHTAPQHPKGDEPDYLVITQSLLRDRDLRIEDNHARADYAVYHREPLPPAYLQRGTDGAIYSVHAPGLPAALVPGFAIAGYAGAVATLIAIAMWGAWLAWRACWRVTQDVTASWVGTLGTVGAAPFFLHGAAIFPDAPASVLALVGVDALLSLPTAARARRWAGVGASLALLPWLHTRYAIIAAGLGLAIVGRLASERQWRAVASFAAPAVIAASAWFGFFLVIYGTPNPSAPYGAYTQMALAHLAPGVPGLLVDQQFGLLSAAPILALAGMAVRRDAGTYMPKTWLRCVAVVALAVLYLCVVAAYRMWWGGLSAPARFLVPLILPLGPLVALGWQSVWTRAGRYLAMALLLVSLALTATLVVVEQGALAYNVRDGVAKLAAWSGPLVDVSAALPAAHRDAPVRVVRDAAVWLGVVAAAWLVWRMLERRRLLGAGAALGSVAIGAPAAAAIVWSAHDVRGLRPAASQVRFLEQQARTDGGTLWTITPPPVGQTRTWFEVEIDSPRHAGPSDYTLLRPGLLPAGRWRLHTDIATPGARLGLALGEGRAAAFLAELAPATDGATVAPVSLPVPVAGVVVKGSREAAAARGRVWLTADAVTPTSDGTVATRVHPLGDVVWLLPDGGVYPEPGGLWLAGDVDVTLGVSSSAPLHLRVQAGGAAVRVDVDGTSSLRAEMAAGETRDVAVTPRDGRLRVRVAGGFRPSVVTPGSGDQRWLGAWISPR